MNKPSFVYVTYIATTPEKLWNALIDPEMTKQYWVGQRNVSDWKVGSPWRHEEYDNANVVDIAGTVLESAPPARLVLSWAYPADVGDPAKTSRVTFDIAPQRGMVKLIVTHEELDPDSRMLKGITSGWPVVLSGLKTLLETGKALPNAELFEPDSAAAAVAG
jgi:uncharacterized protein YndB with AHSA1/START domain